MNIEQLEKLVENESFNSFRPIERDSILQSYLTLLICKELSGLRAELASLKESLLSKVEVPKAGPGRKKNESKDE